MMNQERMLQVLVGPHISEKATLLADSAKQVVFRVLQTATKKEIKSAVEGLFDVKVKKVSTVNVIGKTRNFKQTKGKRSDWKKAYVSLEDGYDINFANME